MAVSYVYPTPIYLANVTASATGLQTPVLDAKDALTVGLPFVVQFVISATATVQLLAGMELNPATGAIVDPLDVTGGGIQASNFYDLIITLPLYQVNITANTGSVKVKVNSGSTSPGDFGKLHLISASTNATQGM